MENESETRKSRIWVHLQFILAIISETAEKIATGDLSRRIPSVSEDELGKLATVLN
jgi:methyl-accepting chemotaxis protein